MRWALLSAMLAACYSPTPHAGARCAGGLCPDGLVCSPATDTCELVAVGLDGSMTLADADVDAPDDGASMTTSPDARACWGSGLLSICPTNLPSAALSVTTFTLINTNTSPLCVAYTGTNPGAYCVVAGTSVSVAAGQTVRAVGSKPLVVLSTSTIIVDGTIDLAAGAGANPSVCVAGGTPTAAQGGPGGSFTGVGGSGGGVVSGLGPAGAPATTTPAVRGGCAGGNGAGTTAGAGGRGGGAVYLIAASSISVSATGSINASGAAGVAATATGGAVNVGAGGGGGGAGGFIGFDAPTVAVLGAAFANGGGGGEGATPNKSGSSGAASSTALVAGSGGSGAVKKGGDGGAGSQGATRTGSNGTAGGTCGRGGASGGGGGGAAGMIYVHPTQTLVGQVSPPPT